MNTDERIPSDLPGADLIAAGTSALRRGEVTAEGLLVAVGATRLRTAGVDVPEPPVLGQAPELALYAALCASGVPDPYGRYNSLLRRLVSFERALEARNTRAPPVSGGVVARWRQRRRIMPPTPREGLMRTFPSAAQGCAAKFYGASH